MRLFVGLSLPIAVKRELTALSARIRTADDGLRWPSSEAWHITLQFLGNADPKQCECVVSRLRNLGHSSVAISFDCLSFFGAGSVLIAGVRATPGLLELQQRVANATQPCGFLADSRTYHPHITLARGRAKRPAILLRGVGGGSGREIKLTGFNAEEFLLYESFIGSAGSRYEIRERFPLRKKSI